MLFVMGFNVLQLHEFLMAISEMVLINVSIIGLVGTYILAYR